MSELSPASIAVDDALAACIQLQGEIIRARPLAAAALRAAADQVVPFAEITPQEDLESRREAMTWGMQHQAQLTRHQLLAIAAELKASSHHH